MDLSIVTGRLLVALASLILNLGARHLPGGLSPRLQTLTTSTGMRILVVAAMFYLSTRDVMLSLGLAFLFFVVVSTLLNEGSMYSMIGRRGVLPMNITPITKDVYDAAVETVLRFRRQVRGYQNVLVNP